MGVSTYVSALRSAAFSATALALAACSGHSGLTLAQVETEAAGAPAIIAQPQPIAVHDGDPALFQIATTGTEPATYQWQRNGVPIPGATGRTYRLPAATAADHGAAFRVVVINEYGAVVSEVGSLSVARETARWDWE